MSAREASKPTRGRPKGTVRGRKPCHSITFDNDLIEWIDALSGHRSSNVNIILRAAKELSEKVSIIKN